jgi:cell division protein FtsB
MNLHRFRLLLRHYYTLDNLVIGVALLIAFAWIWNTMGTLQNNFRLQVQVDNLKQEVEQYDLESQNMALENQYYASSEYLELQAREHLGKVAPGEHVLVLPANTVSENAADNATATSDIPPSNFQLWLSFFFGSKKS